MLSCRNLNLIKNQKNILQDINLEIEHGECIGLVGPNGAGKSSLLKILAFLEQPTSGKLFFEGQEVPRSVSLALRRRIAVVFQEPLLLNTNVYENIAAGLKMRHLPKQEIQQRVEHWLKAFGILHLSKQHVHSLSGGEAQRVSLARAFALEPDLLLLDEPFSSLDAPTVEALLSDLVNVFNTTEVTTLLVSHNFEEIRRLTDRTIILLEGKVRSYGSTSELFRLEHIPEVERFLGHWRTQKVFG